MTNSITENKKSAVIMDNMTCESSGMSLSRSMAQKMMISTIIANANSIVATIRLACGCGMSDPSVGKLASSILVFVA